jgi:hypothetical protein
MDCPLLSIAIATKVAPGEIGTMKSFIAACVALVVIAACGWLVLERYQEPVAVAYTTSGVRL